MIMVIMMVIIMPMTMVMMVMMVMMAISVMMVVTMTMIGMQDGGGGQARPNPPISGNSRFRTCTQGGTLGHWSSLT